MRYKDLKKFLITVFIRSLPKGNHSIENGSIMDSNVDFNEFKDTICVLKVQRNHLMEENQRLAGKVREMEEMISKRTHLKSQTKCKKRLRQRNLVDEHELIDIKVACRKYTKQNSSRIKI